jgi:hypothetical protein
MEMVYHQPIFTINGVLVPTCSWFKITSRLTGRSRGTLVTMALLLWILAVILVVAGIFAIIRGQLIWGIVLIIVGLLVGPGGVSVFT